MADLYQVDFIQGKTDAVDYGLVAHSLVDTVTNRKIITLGLSSEKLQSVSNYTREPRRCTFEVFSDDWIDEYILSGTYEHIRYISHYEVKIYRNTVLVFSGIIDTTSMSVDESVGVVKITCYDKLKLLSVFSDLTHYYSLTAGYPPEWILGYFTQDIMQTIPVAIPTQGNVVIPDRTIALGSLITIVDIDYSDMLAPPEAGGGWAYEVYSSTWASPIYGWYFRPASYCADYIFAEFAVMHGVSGTDHIYQARARGRIVRFYHHIAPVTLEHEYIGSWDASADNLDGAENDLLAFFAKAGFTSTMLGALAGSGNIGDAHYGSSHAVGLFAAASFYGAVYPPRLHPGMGYETNQTEQTENLKALQAMLMLYNATLVCDAQGVIQIVPKGTWSAGLRVIADNDVISLVTTRANAEKPDMTTLDVLAGNTAVLGGYVSEDLIDYHAGVVTAQMTIDRIDTNPILLSDRIEVNGVEYGVTEIERDYINDEMKVKAWAL